MRSTNHAIRSLFNTLIAAAMLMLSTSQLAFAAEIVNINRADAATMIENWKGIGEVKARAIVSYRKKNGNFKSLDDLLNVKGIGEGILKKNRRYMSVSKGLTKPSGRTTKSSSKSTSGSSKSTSKSTKAKSTTSGSAKSSSSKSKKSGSSTKSSQKSSQKSKKSKSSKCTSKSTDKKCKTSKKKKNSTT